MKTVDKGKKQKGPSLPNTLGIAITVWLLCMIVFFAFFGIKSTDFLPLSDRLSADVFYSDGSSRHFGDGNFGTLEKGDRVELSVSLPDSLDIYGAELFLPLYNSIVKVYSGDNLLYEEDASGGISSHYGNKIYEVPLPDDYESEGLLLDIISIQGMPFSDLNGVGIVSASGGWKRILNGNTLIFSISVALMILSLVSIFFFTIRSLFLKRLQIGLPIALFELLINAWFFGSMRMFYLISSNVIFCSKIEYYALYLAPIPLAFFIHTQVEAKLFKKGIAGVTTVYLAYYICATVLELSPIDLNYSDLLSTMHLLAGIMIILLVAALFAGMGKHENRNIRILRYGVFISMLCGFLEIVRFNITKYLLDGSWVATHGVSALAILVIAVSLVIYLISVSADEYTARIEQEQLMVLAYKDALTDMPNRADCYRRIEQMESEGVRAYTMLFFDLNNLKLANDKYGHETGDRLLQTIAKHLKESFVEDGFCARWGGDEFVACSFGEEALAAKRLAQFSESMQKEDESGSFPFKVSAACGQIRSEENAYIDPIEAIRRADALMYENKKRMKAEQAMNQEQRG